MPKVETVFMESLTGKIIAHTLKHLPAEGNSTGPVTLTIALSDDLGNDCKASFVVPRAYAARYPIGAWVSLDLRIRQLEITTNAEAIANEGVELKARRRAANIEDAVEVVHAAAEAN